MNIDEKIKEIENHLHNLYEDADRTYTKHEDADMVIEVTAKQLKEYETILTELKKYKDLETEGKLIKLSCKIGDTVWYVEEDDELSELIVDHIDINDNYIYYHTDEKMTGLSYIVSDDDFSRTAFSTKEEAEMKLKEITKTRKNTATTEDGLVRK